MDLKTKFKIQGQDLEVRRLKVKQFKRFAATLGEYELPEGASAVSGITGIIAEGKNLTKFMADIVFPDQPGAEKIDWDELDYDDLDEVIESFLSLNPRAKKRLTDFSNYFLRKLLAVSIASTMKSDSK